MAIGDVSDMACRIYLVLPQRWFPALELAPVLNGVLSGFGSAWAFCFSLIGYVRDQARISTASGAFLDMLAADFFALTLRRREQETDVSFRDRIQANLLREQATRSGVSAAVSSETGAAVVVFEPGRPADTGGYGASYDPSVGGGGGYGVKRLGYGSLELPFAFLLTVDRPEPTVNTDAIGGYSSLQSGLASSSSGGYSIGAVEYLDLPMLQNVVSDDDIRDAILSAIPVSATAWLAFR